MACLEIINIWLKWVPTVLCLLRVIQWVQNCINEEKILRQSQGGVPDLTCTIIGKNLLWDLVTNLILLEYGVSYIILKCGGTPLLSPYWNTKIFSQIYRGEFHLIHYIAKSWKAHTSLVVIKNWDIFISSNRAVTISFDIHSSIGICIKRSMSQVDEKVCIYKCIVWGEFIPTQH